MTILTWCGQKIRSAYGTCKGAMCSCWTTAVPSDDNGFEIEEYNNYDVHHRYINETDNPRRPVTPTTAAGYPQHRRRPDIPTVKWRPVDPSVFEACKELQVPVGNNDKRPPSDDEAETKTSRA